MKLDLIPWFIVAAASLMLIWVSHSYLDLRDEYTAYKAAVQQYRETAVEAAKQREEEHSKNLVAVKEDYEKRIVEVNAVALRNYRRLRDDAVIGACAEDALKLSAWQEWAKRNGVPVEE